MILILAVVFLGTNEKTEEIILPLQWFPFIPLLNYMS